MKFDTLKQYAKLRQQLLDEKSSLEERLREIREVLDSEEAAAPAPAPAPSSPAPSAKSTPAKAAPAAKRGRPGKSSLSQREAIMQALRERGPLARKELAEAIQELGYVSQAKDPMNSMGIVLYAKDAPFKKKDGKFYLPSNAQAQSNHTQAPKPKRVMSEEGRARIAAAQTARWAKIKKSKS